MRPSSHESNKRRQKRTPAVLPVRGRGTDENGVPFEEIAHTLDITETGARLAAIRRPLKEPSQVTVVYHQRRMAFVVIWVKLIGKQEYQVGLRLIDQKSEGWGLARSNCTTNVHSSMRSVASLAAAAE